MHEMIELTCYRVGKVEKHRRLILRRDIKEVVEMPDTKEVLVVLQGRKGIFRRKIFTAVAESFDEVKALLEKKNSLR